MLRKLNQRMNSTRTIYLVLFFLAFALIFVLTLDARIIFN